MIIYKIHIVVLSIIISFVYSLDVYSGGKLSSDQAGIDIENYDLKLRVDPYKKTIIGKAVIAFILIDRVNKIEIDLLNAYHVSGVAINNMNLSFSHKDHKLFIENPNLKIFKKHTLEIKYGGKPPIAIKPPWDGGFTWETSENGHPWVAVSCQANGAYIWFPCKEHPSDKANGLDLYITVPDPLSVAGNGLLQSVTPEEDNWSTWHWKTEYPISAYNVNFTAGYFEVVERTGYILDKPLKMVYYVLPEKSNGADQLLKDAEMYLNFYAKHFGQYPWIKEKFGLVHTPYWGMEHQTINAYGNDYKKTKLGYDFLMFHEMGHEWWGNYLSVADWSDFWIHEGFDTYAEALFVEEKYGEEASKNFIKNRYKKNIQNKKSVVPPLNTSTKYKTDNDVYYKGAHILHTLRYLIGEDVLRESLKEFINMPKELPQNQTSTKEFISLINENSEKEIQWFFDQYLYKSALPTLMIEKEFIKDKQYVDLWWEDEGFIMPLEISYQSFDGMRVRKLELRNSPTRIAIPATSKLIIDPDGWLLYQKRET